jgi:hypothetical protein
MTERADGPIPANLSAETAKTTRGQREWLPGNADVPMSPRGAKTPHPQTEVIHIQAR